MTSVADLQGKLELIEGHYETLREFSLLKGKKKYRTTIRALIDDIDLLEREIIDGLEEQMEYALSLLSDASADCMNCIVLTDTINDLFRISLELNEDLKELNDATFRLKY